MNPTVSIIISVYNSEVHIRESIESILGQSFTDFEVIVIDDASTDATSEILHEYTEKDARVRSFRNEQNLGLTKSLNKAIRESSGTYIARMDADDIAYPERFEKQVAFLSSCPNYGLVGSWAIVIDNQGKEIDQYQWETKDGEIRKNLIKYNCIIHPSIMMRAEVLEIVGYYDETFRYAQDYDLFFRIVRHFKVQNIAEPLIKYRIGTSSITGSKNRAQAWCAMRARWNAIKRMMYPWWSIVYLLRPLIGMIMPLRLKRMIKKAAL